MKNLIKDYCSDVSGNFAMIFAIASLPVMLSLGGAVDYARYSNDKTKVQDALDAAVLAAGRDINKLSKSDLKNKVKDFLRANLKPVLYNEIGKVQLQVNKRNGTIFGKVKSKTKTTFMQLAGLKKLKFDVVSQVNGPGGGAEIMLVLDNTYSMSVGGKLETLKAASNDFVDSLIDDDGTNNVSIGMVPFSNHVNVGMSYREASWLAVDDDSTTTTEDTCYNTKPVISQSNCVEQTGYNDGVPYTYETCDYVYGDEVEICTPQTISNVWNGCVGSRPDGLNLLDMDYNNNKVPGLMNTWCGLPITPLSSDKKDLKEKIDLMVANYETYIPAGLTWGMRALSSQAPFSQASTANQALDSNIRKFLVLMTDGDNQRSAQLPEHPWHWGSDVEQADQWTAELCDNIKKQDIEIFSVSFGALSAKSKKLIKQCASSNRNYFHASSNDGLKKAFENIGKAISELRLSM